jgi:hypothetical protein
MFCTLRTKITELIQRITGRGADSQDDEPIDLPEGGNPWQASLTRLANERSVVELQEMDEITAFVKDLRAAATGSPVTPDPDELMAKKKRTPEPTVNDIKSWWQLSVATYDPIDGKNVASSDQKRNGRTNNRWRQ